MISIVYFKIFDFHLMFSCSKEQKTFAYVFILFSSEQNILILMVCFSLIIGTINLIVKDTKKSGAELAQLSLSLHYSR